MDDLRATAQAVVTLILHGDRAAASDLALGHRHPGILALVLADLVTYVHTSWFHVSARALGAPPPDSRDLVDQWQHILLDIEARNA